MTYLNTPRDIASALRTIAEDLDHIGDVGRLPDLLVDLHIQVAPMSASPAADCIAAVNLLSMAICRTTTQVRETSDGTCFHSTPGGQYRGGIGVRIFTAVAPEEVPP